MLAVAIINDKEIVTTSQDQMISLWSVDSTEIGSVRLNKKESQFVHVPDPSTMDVLPSEDGQDRTVAIAGIGIQTFVVDGR